MLEIFDYSGAFAHRFDAVDRSGGEHPDELTKLFDENARVARIRMQQEATQSLTISGAGDDGGFAAGQTFTLGRHFDADGRYLLTRVTHSGSLAGTYTGDGGNGEETLVYENHFTCIPVALSFRPPRVTPQPKIQGMQPAEVVGAEDSKPGSIFTDKLGRVKVRFPWQRPGANTTADSPWVPVSTPWAGKNWGMVHIPRVGQKVVVAFHLGNPDQPVVVGMLYTEDDRPPYDLPDQMKVAGVKSRTYGSNDPAKCNEIRMDDTEGKELLHLEAEKDMSTQVAHDSAWHVGHDETVKVDHDVTTTVGHDAITTIGDDATTTVGHNATTTVTNNYRLTVGDDPLTMHLLNYKWDWPGAEAGFRRALDLDPSYATAHQRYSLYLIAMGRTQESMAEIQEALRLDPLSVSMNFSEGWRLYMARNYDAAIRQLQATVEMDPSFALAHLVLGQALTQTGKYGAARAELEKAAQLSGNSAPALAAVACLDAVSGHAADAHAILDRLQKEEQNRYVSPFYMATVYSAMSNSDEAVAWLEKAMADRSNPLIFLRVDPEFDNLRSDARFQTLLHQLRL